MSEPVLSMMAPTLGPLELNDPAFVLYWDGISRKRENVAAVAPDLREACEKRYREIKRRESGTVIDWRQLATVDPPDRVWLLLYWLAMGCSHLFVGAGGIGKSTMLQQIASCLAIARTFIDRIDTPRRVLVWSCEDDRDEVWRRQVAICRWLDVSLEAFAENLIMEPRVGQDNVLFTHEFGRLMFTPAFDLLVEHVMDTDSDVVILDNIAHIFAAESNDRHHVTSFLNGLHGRMRGRTPILAGHPARAAGSEFAGSAAWENAVRVRLYLGRTLPDQIGDADDEGGSDDTVRYLARRKSNYSPRDWRRFTFRDGVLWPDETEPAGGLMTSLRRKQAERVVLDGLRQLTERSVRAVDGATSPAYLPRMLVDYKLGEGLSKKELAEAMRTHLLSGAIVRTVVGHYANRNPMHGLMVAK